MKKENKRLLNVMRDIDEAMREFGVRIANGTMWVMMCEPETDRWGLTTAWAIPTDKPVEDDHVNLRLITWKEATA